MVLGECGLGKLPGQEGSVLLWEEGGREVGKEGRREGGWEG